MISRTPLPREEETSTHLRFLITPSRAGDITEVLDRDSGESIQLETPTALDQYTVEEVFTERAYSLQGPKRRDAVMVPSPDVVYE